MSGIVRFPAGMHIAAAAELLAAEAMASGSASGCFNGIDVSAKAGATAGDVVADWERQSDARREAYRKSPEGIAAAQRADDARRTARSQHDWLMAELPALNWSSDVAILDWLCAMQGPSDHAGVIIRRGTIIAAFAKRGYVPGMDTGKDYDANSRYSGFRYLVGQALDGLANGPAIHPIIHKFAAEWKARLPS